MSRGAYRLLRDFAALSGGELVAKLAGFAAFAYLARALGPDPYGAVELAVALVMFASLIVDFGLGPVGARDATREPARAPRLAAEIPALRLGLVVLAFGFVLAAIGVLDLAPATRRLVAVFALSLLPLPWTLNWLFQSTGRMAWVGLAQPIRMLVFVVGVVALVRGPGDLWRVGAVETAAAVAMAVYYLALQRRSAIPLALRLDRSAGSALLRAAGPVGSSQLLWAANQYVPTVLVAALVGGASVGWFGGSLRIVVSLGTFTWLYFFNLYPALVQSAAEPPERYAALVGPSSRATAWLGIAAGLGGTLLAEPICRLAYGSAFDEAARAFAILVWVLPISLLSGHARFTLIAYGHQSRELAAAAVGSVVTLGLGFAAIPRLGAPGAALAMVGAALAVWVVAHAFAQRHARPLPFGGPVLRPALAAAAGFAVALALPSPSPWLRAAAGLAVYLVPAPWLEPALLRDLRALLASRHGGAPAAAGGGAP